MLIEGASMSKGSADDNAVARNHARASHELRASLNLERNRPSMDQVFIPSLSVNLDTEHALLEELFAPCNKTVLDESSKIHSS